MAENPQSNKSNKKALRIVLGIIFLIIFICCCVYIGFNLYDRFVPETEYTDRTVITQDSTDNKTTVENPIDFTTLQQGNSDIYAWIRIEDTKVDYPIVQSPDSDSFYLKHSAEDKSWLSRGAIYTEGSNTKTFLDPVTVVYGHNGYSDTMFTTLHKFEDKEFFDSHEYFYVYLPGRRLTYQVVSAFKYDDRHIMNSFNFYYGSDLQNFQNIVMNPESMLKNVRTQLDTEIDENSKIIVLSTCITGQKTNRYLVCGVLVKDEKTN